MAGATSERMAELRQMAIASKRRRVAARGPDFFARVEAIQRRRRHREIWGAIRTHEIEHAGPVRSAGFNQKKRSLSLA